MSISYIVWFRAHFYFQVFLLGLFEKKLTGIANLLRKQI